MGSAREAGPAGPTSPSQKSIVAGGVPPVIEAPLTAVRIAAVPAVAAARDAVPPHQRGAGAGQRRVQERNATLRGEGPELEGDAAVGAGGRRHVRHLIVQVTVAEGDEV